MRYEKVRCDAITPGPRLRGNKEQLETWNAIRGAFASHVFVLLHESFHSTSCMDTFHGIVVVRKALSAKKSQADEPA